MENKIVISLGGSLIVPDAVDADFLKGFKGLILEEIKKGSKFVIITGGGRINQRYNEAAKILSTPSDEDLDWIGIAALKLNAELVRVAFGEHAEGKVVEDLSSSFPFERPIVVGSAHEPGRSSDWDAALAARTVGAKKIVNLSNIDYVYDSDPKQNPNAKKIEKISWAEYRRLIPGEWTSRLHSPFDPVASALAEKEGMEIVIMNGKPIDNFANYLKGQTFRGTIIK